MRTAIIITTTIIVTVLIAVIIRFTIAGKNPENKPYPKENQHTEKSEKVNEIEILTTWNVPDILKEISAISYIDDQRFACIQDELGRIFIFNTGTQQIEKEIEFAGSGDYEGLALNGSTAYVLRADGQIFEINNYTNDERAVKQYKTPLTEKQNAEGLTFDKENNRLLISIKGSEPASDQYKGIYAFNLDTRKMQSEPVIKIDLENDVFDEIKSGKKHGSRMQPSEIAIHPKNGDIYVTEGTKPKLLIIDSTGAIISLTELKDDKFSQPEGMTFSPDGRLFISNEGKKGSGNILEVNASE